MLDEKGLIQLDEFRGKSIISISDGQRIGKVEDVLIDPGNMKIEGIITSRGGFLRPDVRAIKAQDVEVWGQDAVLVNHPDVIRKKDEITGLENCLSVSEHIPGRDVITLDGQRIGELKDLLVTVKGELTGYEVSRVRSELADLFEGNKQRFLALPVTTIHSFGKDVLVIDLQAVKGLAEKTSTDTNVEETEPAQTGAEVFETPVDTPAETPYVEDNQPH